MLTVGDTHKRGSRHTNGFTIVELLIVIVVIAILATITIVAYNGIQQRARDSQRRADISTIVKALEMYYTDNGQYPPGLCTANCSINGGWSSTADGSWKNLASQLVPKYLSSLPADPISTPEAAGSFPMNDPKGYDYSYVGLSNYCGIPSSAGRQGFILVYRLEGTQVQTGSCKSAPTAGPYGGSNYYSLKQGS